MPIATHLPFVVEQQDSIITLYSHLSVANQQHKTFEQNNSVLVIFAEPHAYISPSLYEQQQNVPTWNYIAVHCYGTISVAQNNEAKLAILQRQIQEYETNYFNQFEKLDNNYITNLLSGIIAFSIDITTLKAKEKLSQNKSTTDRATIKKHLEEQQDTNLNYLASRMK